MDEKCKALQEYILESIGFPAALEQLAEEASELSQAALKLSRIHRGENPTPVDEEIALIALIEEFTDVLLAADVCEVYKDSTIYSTKLTRWRNRINDRVENKSSNEG